MMTASMSEMWVKKKLKEEKQVLLTLNGIFCGRLSYHLTKKTKNKRKADIDAKQVCRKNLP
jgi:hypothetical protein